MNQTLGVSVGVVGLEPTHLSTPDPKSGAATNYATLRKKHSNDFRSHICQFPVEFIAPTTRTKEPYLYFCNLVSTLYLKLFHIAPQLEMLYCGSGRDRTYSALRQQIYSLPRLSNFGALPI